MPKLRIVLIASFVILGVLLALLVLRPAVVFRESRTVIRESTLMTEDKWIIQYDIINNEEEDATYIINWSSSEKSLTQKVPVLAGEVHRHVYNVYPETVKDGELHLTLYKEGESTPVEEVTYYIDFD